MPQVLFIDGPRNHQTRPPVEFEWMWRTIVVFILASVLSSCVRAEQADQVPSRSAQVPANSPAPQKREQHPTWALRTNERIGIAIRIPSRWSMVWNPLRDGTVGDLLVAGSWRFPELPQCEPIPPGQALLTLSEVVPVVDHPLERLEQDFPPRPRRFETTVLRSLQVRKSCDQPKAQLFRFREADRYLYAWVMSGRDLPTGVRTKAEAVLSTLLAYPVE